MIARRPAARLPMASCSVSLADLVAAARAETAPPWAAWPPAVVRVELDDRPTDAPPLPSWWPAVVVGVGDPRTVGDHPTCDVVVAGDEELAVLDRAVSANPLAATTLVTLLRDAERRTTDEGLRAESAAYSALQAGPEFAAWRGAHPARERATDGPRVRVDRTDDELAVTLCRPEVRNALDTRMRDELVEALQLPAVDPSITKVVLRGDGPTFCAGGDLDEFGSRPDPATAHLVRLLQSAGRAIDRVAGRVTAEVHGDCRGSGVELPAFAGRVVAAPGTTFGLPEVSLGLIPGAGGTVSLPRRIGRHRTAWLALTGGVVDAATAREWGLVDDVAG